MRATHALAYGRHKCHSNSACGIVQRPNGGFQGNACSQ